MSKKRTRPDEPPKTLKIEGAKMVTTISDQAAQIVELAGDVKVAAAGLGIVGTPLEHFWLAPAQRDVVLWASGLSKTIKRKLTEGQSSFTTNEVVSMTNSLAEELPHVEPRKRTPILLVTQHLLERLRHGISGFDETKSRKPTTLKTKTDTKTIFQFKITLKDSKPLIWRRIQVKDCTLDKLHEYIQTAMGWTNSHLHKFEIGENRYADPALMEEDFEEFGCLDSTRTKVSNILPKTGKRFSFSYEYDFGDGWEHEVLFEGCPPPEKGKKYPLCLEGARACPPEDVGGIGGFYEYLEALADPMHEEHEQLIEWRGPFDPEKFDVEEATNEMREGLPDWRE